MLFRDCKAENIRAVSYTHLAVRRGSAGAAPNGRAAGGVGDVHTVAKELGDEARVARLGAAGAGAGELEHGLHELAALDGGILHIGLGRDLVDAVVEDLLLLELALLRDHGQRADRRCV